jgi:acetyl esterase/lipase
MKKTLLAFLLNGLIFICFGQTVQYKTVTGIHYYSDSINQSDNYIQSQCVLDLYYPEGLKNFPTIVWFHGGGLTSGSKEIPEALMGKGFGIIGVGYRLYPKVKCPAYISDAAASVAWVFNNIGRFGGDSSLLFLSGHSAGGYLTMMIGLDKKWLSGFNLDANRIAGLIPFSGQAITHFTIRKERGISDKQPVIDEFAPLYHVRADAPPLLLITGDRELELLGRYEENAYLMRMMKLTGHNETRLYELDGYGHGMTEPAFPLLIQEVRRLVARKGGAAK